jgi:DNA-3-methyladenine glycosylase
VVRRTGGKRDAERDRHRQRRVTVVRRERRRQAPVATGRPASAGRVLPRRFYQRPAPRVARELLGCILVSRLGKTLTAGRIVETEAYLGPEDGASHAAFRPSSRWLFYGPGGVAYVFQAYGLHACLNAIAEPAGTPGCVLIRALEPLTGLRAMARRRRHPVPSGASTREHATLTSGPARLTQALRITLRDNGCDLRQGRLTIHAPVTPARLAVATGPRIGITRSASLSLRFWVRGSPFVSRRSAPASGGSRRLKPDQGQRRGSV